MGRLITLIRNYLELVLLFKPKHILCMHFYIVVCLFKGKNKNFLQVISKTQLTCAVQLFSLFKVRWS